MRMIIGIDIGNTCSGIAATVTTDDSGRWSDIITTNKTNFPNIIFYNHDMKVTHWGSPLAQRLFWTAWKPQGEYKVEWLRLPSVRTESANTNDPATIEHSMILPPGKSDVDIVADFLFKLQETIELEVQQRVGVEITPEYKIDYVVSVPSGFSEGARQTVDTALCQSRLYRRGNTCRLTIITEFEAAARYAVESGLPYLKAHDIFLVVNCGGLLTQSDVFEYISSNPSDIKHIATSHIQLGSMAITDNFHQIVESNTNHLKILKNGGARLIRRTHCLCLEDFEGRIKPEFDNNRSKWAADVAMDFDFAPAHLERGSMVFSNEEIRQCFDPVVEGVSTLINEKIAEAQSQKRDIQHILVVGGLSSSEYFFQCIRQAVPVQYQSCIVRPRDPLAAVMKGNVLLDLAKSV